MLAHVLRPRALRVDLDADLGARNDPRVHERRRVVAGVLPVEERIAHDRAAEVPVLVARRNARVDRVVEIAARDVDVLPELQEHHRVPGVLAVRILPLRRDVLVQQQLVEDLPADRRLLALARDPHQLHHLRRDLVADLHA